MSTSTSTTVPSRAKTSLDYLIENEALYQSSEEYIHKRNPYITAFILSGLAERIVELTKDSESVRKLMNHRKLRKELTESYGAIVLLEKCVHRLHNRQQQLQQHPIQQQHQEDDVPSQLSFPALQRAVSLRTSLIFLDICSGKGITSFLLALLFPTAR